MFIEIVAADPFRRTVLKTRPPVTTSLRYCLLKEMKKFEERRRGESGPAK
jgi:hypothetical protein